MRRSIKFFFIFIALVFIALLAFMATFDANNYRPEIIAQVEKATGRTFTIDGEINLSVFPWVGLTVEHVALGNAEGFKAKQFASIEQLDIKVNVLPLLKKEVQINTIRLHGMNVSLEVASDKSNNWSNILQSDKAADATITSEEKESEPEQEKTEASSPLQSLQVEGFEFVDATISYDDQSSSNKATVSALNLITSAIKFDEAIDVSFSARVENNQPEIDTQLKLTTQVFLNKALTNIDLRDFVFTVLAKKNAFIAQDEKIEIKTSIAISMDDQRVVLKPLQLSALGTTTLADITVSQFLATPLIQGGIEVLAFDARTVAERAGVTLPEMAKADALSKVALKIKIKLQGDKLQANDFNLTLDSSTLSGWLHVLKLSKQQLRYDLAFDHLNINDYLPAVTEEAAVSASVNDNAAGTSAEAVSGPVTTGDEKIELPVEMMRTLDIKGDFRIAALTAKEYEIKQLLLSLQARKGEIVIKPLSMQVLEGQVNASVNVNVKNKTPAYALNLMVNKIQAGPVVNPFLKGVMGEKPLKLDGVVNVNMNVKTAGSAVNQLKKASKGVVTFDMKETRVDGFDPEFYMRSAIADYVHSKGFGLSKTIMGKYKPRKVTVFDKIHSTVNIANGKARTDDFLMDSRRVKVTAKGHVDIMRDALDIVSSVQLPRAKTAIEKIFDEPVFVRIHGPFDALEYELDKDKLKKSTTDVLKNEAKAKLDAEKKRLKDKAKVKLDAEKKRLKDKTKAEQKRVREKTKKKVKKEKDKLKNKLKGLF